MKWSSSAASLRGAAAHFFEVLFPALGRVVGDERDLFATPLQEVNRIHGVDRPV